MKLRTEKTGKPGEWKDYKAISFNGIYLGAFFQCDRSLLDGLIVKNY